MELQGRTALVTGSTDGVGRLVAQSLGEAGVRVLVHGRDVRRGEAVVAAIEAAGGRAEFLVADFASLAEVGHLADAVKKASDRLDILVNNAGIGFGARGAGRELSADGIELRFAVNYVAGFLLTESLLPLLEDSAPARIVNVASAGQRAIIFEDVMLEHGYDGQRAYAQSKLAQILYTFDLAQRFAGRDVAVNCLHPATYMDTTMVRESGISPWSSVEDGAQAILRLAAAPELEGVSGRYYNGLDEERAHEQAYDAESRERLRMLSLRLCGPRSRRGL